jgi:hypothetical protein
MTEQATLFDIPKVLARTLDPVSSHIAAEKMIQEEIISEHEQVIIDVLATYHDDKTFYEYWRKYYKDNNTKFDGMTFREISKCCYLSEAQIWRRLKGLEGKNKIKRGIIRKCTVHKNLMTEWSIL